MGAKNAARIEELSEAIANAIDELAVVLASEVERPGGVGNAPATRFKYEGRWCFLLRDRAGERT